MTGIKSILRRINDFEKVGPFIASVPDIGAVEGSFNKVEFGVLKGVKLVRILSESTDETKKTAETKVVPKKEITVDPKIAISKRQRFDQTHGNTLLREKNFHSAFADTPWYSSPKLQIFEMAPDKDLFQYLYERMPSPVSKNQYNHIDTVIQNYCETPVKLKVSHLKIITLVEIKNLFAQVILGVENLHQAGLVHLDLKVANILVRSTNGKTHLKLIDFDGIQKIDKEGKAVDNTQTDHLFTYLPYKRMPDDGNPYLTAIDGFALWTILFYLYTLSSPDKSKKTDNLMKRLYDTDPKAPFDIQTIKQDEFFGDTAEEREKLFCDLRETFNSEAESSLDEYSSPVPEEKDVFLLLPTQIKSVYHACEQLDNQLDHLDKFAQENMSAKRFCDYNLIVKAVLEKHEQVKDEIDQLSDTTGFEKEIKDLKIELDKQAKKIELHSWTVDQINICQNIRADQLKVVIDEAVSQYIAVNHLDQPRSWLGSLFSLHGEKGKLRVKKFQDEVNAALPQGTKKVFALIERYINQGGGGNFKNSFKPILMNKLMGLCGLALEQWPIYLTTPQKPTVSIQELSGYISLFKLKMHQFLRFKNLPEIKHTEDIHYKESEQVKHISTIFLTLINDKCFKQNSLDNLAIIYAAFSTLPELATNKKLMCVSIENIVQKRNKNNSNAKNNFEEILNKLIPRDTGSNTLTAVRLVS